MSKRDDETYPQWLQRLAREQHERDEAERADLRAREREELERGSEPRPRAPNPGESCTDFRARHREWCRRNPIAHREVKRDDQLAVARSHAREFQAQSRTPWRRR